MANLKDAYKLIHQGILALARAERQGIRVDLERAELQKEELTRTVNELNDRIMDSEFYHDWVKNNKGKPPNLDSPPQLEHYLYRVKKLKPVKFTETGKGSVDQEALEALQISELNDMLRVRKLKKLRDTYIEAYLRESVEGYIHPFFNLHTVTTYRSSSDRPNFQNIPKRDKEAREIVRSCLVPRPGHQLLEVDYGALEVRIAACYHKDPTMIDYIKSGFDMHGDMAKQIFLLDELDKAQPAHDVLRGGAKNGFVFPQFYGDYYGNNAVSLSKWADLPTVSKYKDNNGIMMPEGERLGAHLRRNGIRHLGEFSDHLRSIEEHFWNERFPVYSDWKRKWYRQYQKNGYIDMYTGFRCSGVYGKNNVINYPVQGSAFHCLLWSFIQLDRVIYQNEWDTKLVGQIHDSILLDVHPDELMHVLDLVRQVTCIDLLKEWDWIIVPLEIDADLCDVDASWFDKKATVI